MWGVMSRHPTCARHVLRDTFKRKLSQRLFKRFQRACPVGRGHSHLKVEACTVLDAPLGRTTERLDRPLARHASPVPTILCPLQRQCRHAGHVCAVPSAPLLERPLPTHAKHARPDNFRPVKEQQAAPCARLGRLHLSLVPSSVPCALPENSVVPSARALHRHASRAPRTFSAAQGLRRVPRARLASTALETLDRAPPPFHSRQVPKQEFLWV